MNIYETAIQIQDASNISGVINELEKVIKVVNQEMNEKHLGEEYRRHHPVVILFIDKLLSLSGGYAQWNLDEYSAAYRACRELSSKVQDTA